MIFEDRNLRQDSALVSALFSALDLACDHGDLEIASRLSALLNRLALQEQRATRSEPEPDSAS